MASKDLERKYPTFERAAYGIEHFKEGNYGTIALRWRHRVLPDGRHRYAYLLTGVHNNTGAFPGVRAWNDAISTLETSRWSREKARWTIRVETDVQAQQINALLKPILNEAIRKYRSFRRENHARYLAHHPELKAAETPRTA
jgi:hypothetical protein